MANFPIKNQSPYGPSLKAYIDEQVAAAVADALAAQTAADAAQAGLATKAEQEHRHVVGDTDELQGILDFLAARSGIPTTLEAGYENLKLIYGDNQLPAPSDMPNTVYVVLPAPQIY